MAEPRTRTLSRQRARAARRRFLAALGAFAVLAALVPLAAAADDTSDPAGKSADGALIGHAAAMAVETPVTFGVVGDYGWNHRGSLEQLRAFMAWLDPDHIITTGDNVQTTIPRSGTDKYDFTVGIPFCDFMKGSAPGPECSNGGRASTNRLFAATGNHDYNPSDGGPIDNFVDYFNLPGAGTTSVSPTGSDLYYDVRLGPVHLFVIDSDPMEFESRGDTDDGYADHYDGSPGAIQRQWLEDAVEESDAPWKVVAMHHPPYSSGASYGSHGFVQWDYDDMGVDLVLAGHHHAYERVERDGVVYLTNGLGGDDTYRNWGGTVTGSKFRWPVAPQELRMGLVELSATSSTLELRTRIFDPDDPERDPFRSADVRQIDSYSFPPKAATVEVTTSSLPSGTVGTAYSRSLAATGGTTPYTWTRTGGDQLHPGLNLSSGGVISGTPTVSGTRTVQFRATDVNGVQSAPKSLTLTVDAGPTPTGGAFAGMAPSRVLDTRLAGQGPCVSGARDVTVAPSSGVPADAAAVALNVTVVGPSAPGYATVYPTGQARPTASNLNYLRGQVVPNHVTAKVGAGGKVTVFTSGGCPDVVVDVAGYFVAGSPIVGGFTGITPRRVLDTRTSGTCVSGTAGRVVPVAPTAGSVPADASAVALNVTVGQPSANGYATVYPDGTPRPTASNVNYRTGQVVPNAALVKVGTDGRLRVFASGGCPHVVVDVVGYHKG